MVLIFEFDVEYFSSSISSLLLTPKKKEKKKEKQKNKKREHINPRIAPQLHISIVLYFSRVGESKI